jgi:hypothetical protein
VSEHRLVFVGGLHRSGTTLVARALASHPDVAGLTNTNTPEDEGQHLQRVYPPGDALGGPGRFALDDRAHLTEASPLISTEHRAMLLDAWEPYWDLTKPVLVEKSPPNLVRFRFLHALFPDARFVAVVRHPIPVVLATAKMAPGTSESTRLANWLAAHETFAADRAQLAHVHVVRYDDLVAEPRATLDALLAFCDLTLHPLAVDVSAGGDDRYFAEWRTARGTTRIRRSLLARRSDRRVRALGFGYSLRAFPASG